METLHGFVHFIREHMMSFHGQGWNGAELMDQFEMPLPVHVWGLRNDFQEI